jgi:hypothetical protein
MVILEFWDDTEEKLKLTLLELNEVKIAPINNILINYRKVLFIIEGFIFISLLDAFYCFLVKAKDQGKYIKELDIERERYSIVVEQLNDIIFDFDLTEKKIISSCKFEEKFGLTLNIQNYNNNFLNEFKIHNDDKILINRLYNNLNAAYVGNNDTKILVFASVGIALYHKHGKTLESLIKKSDLALYKSKENGKNQFSFFIKGVLYT